MDAAARSTPPARVVIATVVGVTLRAWFNDLERSFGSRRGARALVAGWCLLLALWLFLGTRQLIGVLGLETDQAGALAKPTAAMLIALPALTPLLATVYSPSRTALNDLLATLPV